MTRQNTTLSSRRRDQPLLGLLLRAQAMKGQVQSKEDKRKFIIEQFNCGYTGVVIRAKAEELEDLPCVQTITPMGPGMVQVNFKRKKK